MHTQSYTYKSIQNREYTLLYVLVQASLLIAHGWYRKNGFKLRFGQLEHDDASSIT